jgi:hypothetical protein
MRQYPWEMNNLEFKLDIENNIVKNVKFNPHDKLSITDEDLEKQWVKILNFSHKGRDSVIDFKLPNWSKIEEINFTSSIKWVIEKWYRTRNYSITLPNGYNFTIFWGKLYTSIEELLATERSEKQKIYHCNNYKADLSHLLSSDLREEIKETYYKINREVSNMRENTKIEEWILWWVFIPFDNKLRENFKKLEKEWFIKINKELKARKEFKKYIDNLKKSWNANNIDLYAKQIDENYDNEKYSEYNYYTIQILWNKKLEKLNYHIEYHIELKNWKKAKLLFYFKTFSGEITNNWILSIKLKEIEFIN